MMPRPSIKTGEKFGRLRAVKYVYKESQRHGGNHVWLFKCDCGNSSKINASRVACGKTVSCGCYGKEVAKTANFIHGGRGTRLYRIWRGMLNRCTNKKVHAYKNYGGRGIKVCKRWEKFILFKKDMGEPPTYSITLDRIDVNKGYYKANCRWVERSRQQRNCRSTLYVIFKGIKKPLIDVCDELGIPYARTWDRLYRNKRKWSLEEIITHDSK